jgi:hypothetical protein
MDGAEICGRLAPRTAATGINHPNVAAIDGPFGPSRASESSRVGGIRHVWRSPVTRLCGGVADYRVPVAAARVPFSVA